MAPSIHNSHHDESFPLDQLKFFEHRVRKHSATQIVKIGTSLDRFGCVLPIGITADGYVVCGEARGCCQSNANQSPASKSGRVI